MTLSADQEIAVKAAPESQIKSTLTDPFGPVIFTLLTTIGMSIDNFMTISHLKHYCIAFRNKWTGKSDIDIIKPTLD